MFGDEVPWLLSLWCRPRSVQDSRIDRHRLETEHGRGPPWDKSEPNHGVLFFFIMVAYLSWILQSNDGLT